MKNIATSPRQYKGIYQCAGRSNDALNPLATEKDRIDWLKNKGSSTETRCIVLKDDGTYWGLVIGYYGGASIGSTLNAASRALVVADSDEQGRYIDVNGEIIRGIFA